MEQSLRAIIARIEKAKIPITEKDELYIHIRSTLHEIVWPVLLKHMPLAELQTLANQPSLDGYTSLLTQALQSQNMYAELEDTLSAYLEQLDVLLTKHSL